VDTGYLEMRMQFFFYGSLRDRQVLAIVIGRAIDGLRIEAATIHGFARRRVRDKSFPILVPLSGGRAEGVLVTNLTQTDIARLQFFEGQQYVLVALPVECGGKQLSAQVFLPTDRLQAEETPWDFDSWVESERDLFRAMAEKRMSQYGQHQHLGE
jgi:hypothetical protein